jgi:hypothetical protein
METLVNVILQIVGGAVGGNGVAATMKDVNLGALGNSVVGGLGGIAGVQILSALIPALAGAVGGNIDIAALAGQLVGGGVAGAIVTAIVGYIKNSMAGHSVR